MKLQPIKKPALPLEKVGDLYVAKNGSRWQTYVPKDCKINRTFEHNETHNVWFELF